MRAAPTFGCSACVSRPLLRVSHVHEQHGGAHGRVRGRGRRVCPQHRRRGVRATPSERQMGTGPRRGPRRRLLLRTWAPPPPCCEWLPGHHDLLSGTSTNYHQAAHGRSPSGHLAAQTRLMGRYGSVEGCKRVFRSWNDGVAPVRGRVPACRPPRGSTAARSSSRATPRPRSRSSSYFLSARPRVGACGTSGPPGRCLTAGDELGRV